MTWSKVSLEEVADEITVGFVGSMAEEYINNGVLFFRSLNIDPYRINFNDIRYISENFHKKIKKSTLRPGDVVIVRTGKPGTCAVVPESIPEANCSDLVIVRPGKNLNSRFLAYYINSAAAQHVASHLVGAVQQHFNIGSARVMQLELPTLPEQRAIAHVLGSLDDKIELNRQMNETLEEMARTLFRSWFVDFDPVHAKAAGRQPEGMDAETAALFPSEFVESELGMIPKGWVMATINDVAAINARTLSKNDALDRIRYIEISEVQRGEIGNIAEYERGQEPSRARRRLQHGDTAMSTVRPDRGAYFLAHHPEEDLIASTGFAVLTPQTVPWAFLFLSLTQPEVFTYLGHIADGGAYPAINPGAIGDLRLVLPDEAVLKTFSDLVTPILEQMEEVRKENRGLAVLRDELLPKLISGDVRIPEDMIAEFASGAESA